MRLRAVGHRAHPVPHLQLGRKEPGVVPAGTDGLAASARRGGEALNPSCDYSPYLAAHSAVWRATVLGPKGGRLCQGRLCEYHKRCMLWELRVAKFSLLLERVSAKR